MTSKPSSDSPASFSLCSSNSRAAAMEPSPAHSTARSATVGTRRSVAAVTIPSVPSEPISSCLRSNPRLSFFSGTRASNTPPSASTASIPSTCARIEPWRSTCVPPAFVEISPPIVAEPLPPSVRGKRRRCAAAASCSVCRITPASQVASRASGSSLRTAFIRLSERSSVSPLSSGVAPPDMPLLPPCGTTGTPCREQSFISADSSAVDAGEAIARARPV